MNFTLPINAGTNTIAPYLEQQPSGGKTAFTEMFEKLTRIYNAMLTSMQEIGTEKKPDFNKLLNKIVRVESYRPLLLEGLSRLAITKEERFKLSFNMMNNSSRKISIEALLLILQLDLTQDHRLALLLKGVEALEENSEEFSRFSISKENEWEFLNESLHRLKSPTNSELDQLVGLCTNQWNRSRLCESISEKYCAQYYSGPKLIELQLDEEANFTIFYRCLKAQILEDEEVSLLKQLNVRDEQLMELMRKISKNWLEWDEFKELILLSNRLKGEDRDNVLRDLFDVNVCGWFENFLNELCEFKFSAHLLGDLFQSLLEKIISSTNRILSLDLKTLGYTPNEIKAIFIKSVKVMMLRPDNEMKQLCEKWCCPIEAMDEAIFANEDIDTDYLMRIMERRLAEKCPNREELYYLHQNFMEVFPEKPVEEQALLVQLLYTDLIRLLKGDLNTDVSFGASFYADSNFEAAVTLYYSDYAHLLPAEKIMELFSLIVIHWKRHGKEWTFIELEDLFRTYPEDKPEKCHPLIHLIKHLPINEIQLARFAFILAAFPSNHRMLLRLIPSLELNGSVNYRLLKNILKRCNANLIPDISEHLQEYELSSTHTLLLLKRALSKADSKGLIDLFCHLHDYPLSVEDRSLFLKALCSVKSHRCTSTIIKVLPHLGYTKEEIYIFLQSAIKHYPDFNTERIQSEPTNG